MAKLVVNVGGMFAGKSTELLREGTRALIAGRNVIYIKPALDNRYSENEIVTHDGKKVTALSIPQETFLFLVPEILAADVVLIDEVQFFNKSIVADIEELLVLGRDIYVSGLDLDFQGKPFDVTAYLMGIADEIKKFKAVCESCGADAWVSHKRKAKESTSRIELGAKDLYIPLCRKCFYKAISRC